MEYVIIAATAAQAIGALQQGQAASNAANYNAQVAANNAEIARQQGAAAQEQQQRDSIRKIGAMRAGYGASGVEMSGSPLDVLSDSVAQATLDGLTTKYNYDVRANGYSAQADLNRSQASSASTAGYLNAGAAIGKGVSSYAAAGYDLPFGLGSGKTGVSGTGE
jgi:hypothetical protein